MARRRSIVRALRRLPERSGSPTPPFVADLEPEFLELYEQASPYSMTSIERMYGLYQAVRFVVANAIPGAFVECGVWRGGSSMLAASAFAALGDTGREMYLYDTFAGMPEPGDVDKDWTGRDAGRKWTAFNELDGNGWCFASLEDVRQNMARTGYPAPKLHLVEGTVEETIPVNSPDAISILRLDTDFYSSTLHELKHLFPRLSHHGVLILDDYGHWNGVRAAVDEYLATVPGALMLTKLDGAARLALKVGGG